MRYTSLTSSRSPLAIAVCFATGLLGAGVTAVQLAVHDFWWWAASLLVMTILLITLGLYRLFHFAYLHQEQQQLELQQLQQQLQGAEHRLQETHNLHSLLLHHAGQGIFGVAADGRINFTNPAAEKIIGYTTEEMAGKKMHPLIHHRHRSGENYPEDECPLYLTLKDGITRHIPDEIFWHADKTPIDVDYVVAALKAQEKIIGAVVMFSDTTSAHKQQALLNQRELSLAQAQELAQLASWRFDIHQRELECSDECYRILEWQLGEPLKFTHLLRMIYPHDRSTVFTRWRKFSKGKMSDIEYRIKVGDDIKWLRERCEVQGSDDGELYCVGTVLEITEMKNREAQLRRSKQRLRELVAHREQAREEERAHIAREVHDELGQQLTVLRMDTTMLKLRYAETSPEFDAHILRMKEAIDSCIVSVRQVASSLRPAVLDMGLTASVDWLLKSFSERTGISTVFNAPPEDLSLDDARATAVFRVLQESLTNIARHAQASQLEVCLRCEDRVLHITVADDGKGFDSKVVRNKRGFGLMGMRERVLVFGGQARFDTVIGQGTTVRLSIPLH